MSAKATTWVWDHSKSEGNDRLVLLAIADEANHQGANSYAGLDTLVAKTKIAKRTVQRCIIRLKNMGELAVQEEGGRRGPARVTVFCLPKMNKGGQSDHPSNEPDIEEGGQRVVRGWSEGGHDNAMTSPNADTLTLTLKEQYLGQSPIGDLTSKSEIQQLVGFFVDECTRGGRRALSARKAMIGKKVKQLLEQGLATPDEIKAGIERAVELGRPDILENLVADIQGGPAPKREEDLTAAYEYCARYATKEVIEEEEGRMRANGFVPTRKTLIAAVVKRMVRVGVRMPSAPEPEPKRRKYRGGEPERIGGDVETILEERR